MPTPQEIERQQIEAFAAELDVDPGEAAAIAGQESRFNNTAVSPKGAKGTMQVMDETSGDMAAKYGPDRRRQGIGYYKDLLVDPELIGEGSELAGLPHETRRSFAFAGYNGGPGTLRRARKRAAQMGLDATDPDIVLAFMPRETQDYVPGVMGRLTAKAPGTEVTAGPGVADVGVDDPEAELMGLANEGVEDDDPEAELMALAAGEAAPSPTTAPPRSLGANIYDRTVGRLARATDSALGGLPSALAGVAGAASVGDEAGIDAALQEGGGTAQRLGGVATGTLEAGLTAAFPGASAVGAAGGVVGEAATGSETVGDVAEIGATVGPGLARGAVKGARGARRLMGGRSAADDVIEGLSAQRTAQEVGKELQAPKQGAREAISTVSKEGSRRYGEAAGTAKAAGSTVGASDLSRAARRALRDAKESGAPIAGPARRLITRIVKQTRGKKSAILNAQGQASRTPGTDMAVDELLDIHSSLQREIGKTPFTNGGRRALVDLSKRIDRMIDQASSGTQVAPKLRGARDYYRETVAPTKKTAEKVTRAETPEQATRVLTGGKTPTRFERVAKAAPASAEPTRSAFFNDMVQGAMEDGSMNLRKLAKNLSKAEADGKLTQMADTVARRRTIRAVQRAAKFQRAAKKAPVIGAAGGVSTGFLGLGAGYVAGRVLETAMTSERASRALLRLAQARQGTTGWRSAAAKLKKLVGPATGSTTARAVGQNRENDDGND